MDKTSLSISMDTERLDALNYYLLKEKTSSLQNELARKDDDLYDKTVPPDHPHYNARPAQHHEKSPCLRAKPGSSCRCLEGLEPWLRER